MNMETAFGGVIYSYTRGQAIADGVLVDVSVPALEAGFCCRVALTAAAWADCVEWTDADTKRQTYQDESGRLWDLLWMARIAGRHSNSDRLAFEVYRVPRGGRGVRPRLMTLHAVIAPGDNGEPVVTIMLPHED